MAGATISRLEEVRAYVKKTSVQAAVEHFGLQRETIRRYVRKGNRSDGADVADGVDVMKSNKTLEKIAALYTPKELKLLANGGMPTEYGHKPVHNFKGEKWKIGYLSDTHLGSVYTDTTYLEDAHREFKKAKVDMIVHAGDVFEGMSNRPGHMYECSHLGYDKQLQHGIDVFSKFDFCPVYMVDGNHDRWFMKSNGAKIVKALCKELPCAKFIGHDEGDIVVNKVRIKLWHGEDGSSYALSYRLQKLIESFSGGEKPHLLYAGHVHKYGKFFIRNVHCISTGSIQKQSKWMRGKRLAAHTGFGITELTINDGGVGKITDTYYPFYA
jgi:predicted phosphodiesterase